MDPNHQKPKVATSTYFCSISSIKVDYFEFFVKGGGGGVEMCLPHQHARMTSATTPCHLVLFQYALHKNKGSEAGGKM